jgi:hypothetical protein
LTAFFPSRTGSFNGLSSFKTLWVVVASYDVFRLCRLHRGKSDKRPVKYNSVNFSDLKHFAYFNHPKQTTTFKIESI